MNARLPLYERYMRDEEREANRRMRRRDPIKAEREEAFRAGLSGNWRDARPGDVPPRVTTPDRKAASIEAWRSAPAVRREYERGLRNGWIGAMLFSCFGVPAMSAIKDGGPAFPSPQLLDASGMPRYGEGEFGMALRDYFAAKAMQTYCANGNWPYRELAQTAYELADAMLAAREAQP